MGVGGPAGRRDTVERERLERRCKVYQTSLTRTEARITSYERELEALVGSAALAAEQVEAEVDESEVVVWGHDLDVRYGAIYRYRFTLRIYNPFFGRKILLTPEQAELANDLTVASQTSEWSADVQVEPPLRVFVTRATPPDDQARGGLLGRDLGSVSAEVFRFFDGRWWRDVFRVEPGERIGSAQNAAPRGQAPVEIDFGTDWFVLDVVHDPRRSGDSDPGALVMLQNLRTGELSPYRDPRREAQSLQLLDLRSLVELAEMDMVSMAGP
jgi:hypothetical protein